MMESIRNNTPSKIGKYEVLEFRDYKLEKVKNMRNGEETKTDLPNSNVLYFELENDAWCCVRPSGTEPKIKFYIGVKESSMGKAVESLEELASEVKNLG